MTSKQTDQCNVMDLGPYSTLMKTVVSGATLGFALEDVSSEAAEPPQAEGV